MMDIGRIEKISELLMEKFREELDLTNEVMIENIDSVNDLMTNLDSDKIAKMLLNRDVTKISQAITDRIKINEDVIYRWTTLPEEDQLKHEELVVVMDAISEMNENVKFFSALRGLFEGLGSISPNLVVIFKFFDKYGR